MRTVVLCIAVLALVGCGNRVLNPEDLEGLDWRWEGRRLHVGNPGEETRERVAVRARFWQEEVPEQTSTGGYQQHHTPAGWWTSSALIPEIEPGDEAVVGFSYNVGPGSRELTPEEIETARHRVLPDVEPPPIPDEHTGVEPPPSHPARDPADPGD